MSQVPGGGWRSAPQDPESDRRGISRRVHWSGRTHASRAIENSTHWASTAVGVQAIAKPRTVCFEPSGYSRSTHSAGDGGTDSVIPPAGGSSWRGGRNWCVVGGSPCHPAALATPDIRDARSSRPSRRRVRGHGESRRRCGARRRPVHATTLRARGRRPRKGCVRWRAWPGESACDGGSTRRPPTPRGPANTRSTGPGRRKRSTPWRSPSWSASIRPDKRGPPTVRGSWPAR
jgi:hypothetical protein